MEFLALTGWFAWTIAALVFFSAMCWSVERDNALGATVTFAVFLGGFQWLTDFKPFTLLFEHPRYIFAYGAAYLLAGLLWGVAKWAFFVYRTRDRYAELRERFLRDKGLTAALLTDSQRAQMVDYCERMIGFDLPMSVIRHKSRVITWMAYWPVSALWTLLHDPITRFYAWSYTRISGLLQTISERAFAGFSGDFKA